MNNFETVTIEHAEIGCKRYNIVIGKIKRAAKIAEKHGLPAPKVLAEEEYTVKRFKPHEFGDSYHNGNYGFWRYSTHVRLTLDRKMVKLEGYTPVVHIDEIGIISRICDESIMTDEELIKIRRDREESLMLCDHCKKARRRKMVVVCRKDETGELISFGKQCLKTVTGLHITDNFLDPLAFNSSDPDFDFWQPNAAQRFLAADVIAVALDVIANGGYVSNNEARHDPQKQPTAAIVEAILNSEKAFTQIMSNPQKKWTWEKVYSIIRWVDDHDGSNNYILNLKLIFDQEVIKASHIGWVVSAIAAKQREESIREEAKHQLPSNHIGEVGERIFKQRPVKASLIFVKYLENDWGTTTMMKFVTEKGDHLTWFASGYYEVDSGIECIIKGATVKKHLVYAGVKQTSVNRVNVEWAE